MTKNNPFIGDNLIEAREARALNQTQLAKLIGITRSSVSQYENNIKKPSPDIMFKISNVLDLPIHFFYSNRKHSIAGRVVFFRSMSVATKTSRVQAMRKLSWLIECAHFLSNYIDFPSVQYPNFDVPSNPNNLAFDEIEDLALKTREFWGLDRGPISNLLWLLENNGGIIGKQLYRNNTLDAFSYVNDEDGTPYYVLITNKSSAVRSRFNAAHELAHIVLHKNVSLENLKKEETFKLIENQAHHFAGAFLLPEDGFANDALVPSLNLLLSLKSKWKVSLSAMIMRMRNLELISKEREQRLFENLSRKGWRTREPLDDQIDIEEPRMLRRAFEMLFEENIINNDDIFNSLNIHLNDLEDVVGLPDFFDRTRGMYKFPKYKH